MALGTALLAVSTALKIGGEIAGFVSEDKRAREQREAANAALRLKSRDISIRGIEERQAARQKIVQGTRQAQGALGLSRASAAAAGVEGASADAIERGIRGDLARFYQSVDSNLMITLDQLDRIRAGAYAERDRRVNAAQGPSLTSTLLRIGGAGVGLLRGLRANDPGDIADVPEKKEEESDDTSKERKED